VDRDEEVTVRGVLRARVLHTGSHRGSVADAFARVRPFLDEHTAPAGATSLELGTPGAAVPAWVAAELPPGTRRAEGVGRLGYDCDRGARVPIAAVAALIERLEAIGRLSIQVRCDGFRVRADGHELRHEDGDPTSLFTFEARSGGVAELGGALYFPWSEPTAAFDAVFRSIAGVLHLDPTQVRRETRAASGATTVRKVPYG
jgi:hypothetical protein